VSAGLPGLGLGGLFFVLSALLAPFVELIRTARGRSSVAAWRAVCRQFALALTMVAAVELTLRSLCTLADATGLAGPLSDRSPTVLALLPIGITLGLLACVLAAAKTMQLIATIGTRGQPLVSALRARRCRPRWPGQLGALTAVRWTLLVAPPDLAHAPAGGKAAATDQAPGPVGRTPSSVMSNGAANSSSSIISSPAGRLRGRRGEKPAQQASQCAGGLPLGEVGDAIEHDESAPR
jgi:hypothetical protein